MGMTYTLIMNFAMLFRRLAKKFSDDWRCLDTTIGENIFMKIGKAYCIK